MIYILLSILLSTLIVVTFKLFTRFKIDNLQAIVVNYIVASLFGFSLSGNFAQIIEIPHQKWFLCAILSGFFLMFVFNVFALSSQKVGIAITAVSSKMSVVIPIALGIILFGESLSILRFLGIIMALAAFYLTFKKDSKAKFQKIYFLLPVLLFLGNGTNDSLLNYAEKKLLNGDIMIFLSTAFFVSLLFGLMALIIRSIRKPEKIMFKNILAGIILGLLNFGSTYYFLVCLGMFESSLFFPVFNVSIVSTAALIGYFIFREKLLLINWIGIFLAGCAIVVIAFT